jgi:hypothetical protein
VVQGSLNDIVQTQKKMGIAARSRCELASPHWLASFVALVVVVVVVAGVVGMGFECARLNRSQISLDKKIRFLFFLSKPHP